LGYDLEVGRENAIGGEEALQELNSKSYFYNAEIIGDFPDKIFPIEPSLELKVGAQIMFIKNDISHEKKFFNGKMGVIKSLSDKEIIVLFPEENKTIEVDLYSWENIKYSVDENTKEIKEEVSKSAVDNFNLKGSNLIK
jgi:ATP-dependent exoDNAse (exonuclease V) alpha subunit